MEDAMKQALEIVKAQASVRTMTEDEITSMIQRLTQQIQGISTGEDDVEQAAEPAVEPKQSIREKSVVCLVCGKTFKVLTKKHLATHDLTPTEYKEKYGLKKGTPLIAKGLARDRRKKMQEMKLWERRGKAAGRKKKDQ
ncbi:MAG: MucR family transcriptional regulator [Desulfovibrionales bacterium]